MKFQSINSNRIKWMKMPWDGIYNKILMWDDKTGAVIELAKIKKGKTFPPHIHTVMQTLFLVEGELKLPGGSTIKSGQFSVIPAGVRHGNYYAVKDSVQFKYFSSTPVYIMDDNSVFIYRKRGPTVSLGRLTKSRK